jgi:hypothetical protein
MAYPYLTISSTTTDLNTGSFYSESDLTTFNASQSNDIFFGSSEKDIIEFSIFDISGNLISSSIINKNDTYNVLNGNYKDVDQNSLSYSYKKFNTSYIINKNRNILLDTLSDINNLGIPRGSNVVSYNFTKNVAGDNKYKLIIKDISVDRKEISLIPSFKLDLTNEDNVLTNLYYECFCQKLILVKDIIDLIQNKLNTFKLNDSYEVAAARDPAAVESMKSIFGLKTDSDIVEFLNKIYKGFSIKYDQGNNTTISKKYEGIINYITNWTYTYYKNIVSVIDLKSQFNYIINTAVFNELSVFNYNYVSLDTNKNVANFINSIFYDNFISPALDDINNIYQKKFYSYLKNALNFGNNTYVPILTHGFIQDNNNNTILILKLVDYLPSNINLRETCWVSNISNVPIIQKVIINTPSVKQRYKISGPNFKINLNQNNKSKPINNKTASQLTDPALSNQIEFNKNLQKLNVDYTNFKNFIIFSSAQLRVKLFNNKLNQLNSLSSSLAIVQSDALNAGVNVNAFVSASYQYDTIAINSQMQSIYQSFDGYESYLYNNQYILKDAAYTDYLNSAIQYDADNRDSLVNNTPEYINVNDANSDYLVFLSMVGHFFDNLYIYIGNFPTNQYIQNSSSSSYANSLVNMMLENFGWNPIDSTEASSISDYYLDNTQVSTSENLSKSDKIKTIWSRILNTLPYIYKTKGTSEAINTLANIYGIPKNLINISEYGGNSISSDDQSSYTFDEKYYFTKYSGSQEYVTIPINSQFSSFEFKFNFSSLKKYNYLDKIFLVKNNNLQVYIIKDIDEKFGKLYFKIYDQTLNTNSLPFFNGKYFSVLIKRTPQTDNSDIPIVSSFYTIDVISMEQDRIVFQENSEVLLSNSYITYFTSLPLNFGNVIGSNNNFYGTLDKINVWNIPLSKTAFIDHSKNFYSYNDYDLNNTYQNLYFRYNFDYPVDLSQTNTITNYNKYYNGITGSCFNFTANSSSIVNCTSQPISTYPYQFLEVDILQNLTYNNFGPNVFKQSKINKSNQSVISRLMPHESSTTPILINNNSNLVGVYISPYSNRNYDIINFIGNYDIMDIIGDPSYIYSSSYDSLQLLRNEYNLRNLSEQILYQEFITLYKGYFDTSFFETVKKLIPARSNLFTGILIEPSIIERNKYTNKPIESSNVEILNCSPKNKLYKLTSNTINVVTFPLNGNTPKSINIFYDINKTNYISNDHMDLRLSAWSSNGVYPLITKDQGFVNYLIYKVVTPKYNLNKVINDLNLEYITGSYTTYNFINSASVSNTTFINNSLDMNAYPVGHYSLLRNATSRKTIIDKFTSYPGFLTTSNNTVNQSGSLDGSSPITMTSTKVTNTKSNLISL